MERVIADSYIKGRKQTIGKDPNSAFNQRVQALNRLYGFMYEKGILEKAAFMYQDCPDATYFALDVKRLEPYRKEMEGSGIEGAELASRHIFDEKYTPCTYSGAIQPGWLMMNYREIDGCVGKSWECDLVKWLNAQAVQEIYGVKEKQGVKAAVRKMFSYYNWPEQVNEKKTEFASVTGAKTDYKSSDSRTEEAESVISEGEQDEKQDAVPERTWMCAYKDVLERFDERDNLTDICVPTDWLMAELKKEGIQPREWFDEYTADDTEEIARRAMEEGVILDCSDPELRGRLVANGGISQEEKQTLSDAIQNAGNQSAEVGAREKHREKGREIER